MEACGEFGGFEAGQTAGACRWLGHVADRGVALMACALLATREPSSTPAGSVWGVVRVVATGGLEAFGGFEAGQTAVLNPLKTGWQGHV